MYISGGDVKRGVHKKIELELTLRWIYFNL